MSKIEWTERTWNPVTGCSKVSEGCKNCYALRMTWRHVNNPEIKAKYEGTARKSEAGNINFTGKINMLEDVLFEPQKRKKPTMYFVNSMSDLFHEGVSFDFIDSVFCVMANCPQHTFQILTKRPERMLEFMQEALKLNGGYSLPLSNVWLGASVENQKAANERIPILLSVPAAIRFLSCEPLLGPVEFYKTANAMLADGNRAWDLNDLLSGIHWVIAGGESGPNARPSHPDWFRSLRDQCAGAETPFFFKQWGEWFPLDHAEDEQYWSSTKSIEMKEGSIQQYTMLKVGKKAAGNLLDGRTHLEFPVTEPKQLDT
jgi:protein gp37